jgi:hypothetical protein
MFRVKNPKKRQVLSRAAGGLLYFSQAGLFYIGFLIHFWDNKLQFWPERLHILYKRGQKCLNLSL